MRGLFMRARDKTGKIVEIWQISRKGPQPIWVKDAFAKNYLVWIDNHLRILLAGISPSVSQNIKKGATGSLGGGGFLGYSMYTLGFPGDVIDITNRKVLSPKQFAKSYQVISEQDMT
ncbi:hypothetical protein RT42_GL001977 [Enterococcus cecorum DSM 20682 = ATCC 43198]|nr:hypothetical protein RT42_GL001977 [Enterococcus cecorum DSM 20682 = ATCC 43198]